MGKNILMPFSFVAEAYSLLMRLNDYDLDVETLSICKALKRAINDKLSASDRRESFSRYKAAPHGSAEREYYRRDYLDKAGIHKDWRSDKEISF